MAINPMQLLKLKGMWDQFTQRHPKFPAFLKAMTQGAVTKEDMELVEEVRNGMKG